MSISALPSGNLRVQCYDPSTGRNVSVAKILGTPGKTWPNTKQGRRDAVRAREDARAMLGQVVRQAVTVESFAERWTSDPIFTARWKESTRKHYAERVGQFAAVYGSLPLTLVSDDVVAEWLAGGKNVGTVASLRAMFNAAKSAKAGRLVMSNPFAELGLEQGKGNALVDPPPPETIERLFTLARRYGGPYYEGWMRVACATGMRPGELDGLRWDDVDWDAGRIRVDRQFNAKSNTFTPPKNGKRRKAILTPPARAALFDLPRVSEFCFVNSYGRHWTASAREHHWDRVQAKAGLEDEKTLYVCTRHFAGWFMTNVLRLPAEDVAVALGHEDGGYLVRTRYGHLDKDAAQDRVLRAYEGNVSPLRSVAVPPTSSAHGGQDG